jgi:hypothetical protein
MHGGFRIKFIERLQKCRVRCEVGWLYTYLLLGTFITSLPLISIYCRYKSVFGNVVI